MRRPFLLAPTLAHVDTLRSVHANHAAHRPERSAPRSSSLILTTGAFAKVS